jgi:hypothetical protein
LIILDFFKSESSLKIPLLHHAASFGLSVEGGPMVKEWDFEAGFFFLNQKNKISNFVFMSYGYYWPFSV